MFIPYDDESMPIETYVRELIKHFGGRVFTFITKVLDERVEIQASADELDCLRSKVTELSSKQTSQVKDETKPTKRQPSQEFQIKKLQEKIKRFELMKTLVRQALDGKSFETLPLSKETTEMSTQTEKNCADEDAPPPAKSGKRKRDASQGNKQERQRAQLLRIVKVPFATFGEQLDLTYDQPYYMSLAGNEINSIEIDIKDGTGAPIDFKFGKVEIVLHFKKKNKSNG